jgi:hypothetical protein
MQGEQLFSHQALLDCAGPYPETTSEPKIILNFDSKLPVNLWELAIIFYHNYCNN